MLAPDGCVVDLHPTETLATVEAGRTVATLDAGDAPFRHAAASDAIATAVRERMFVAEGSLTFSFYTYGDSIDELRAFVAKTWRSTRIGPETVEQTRETLRHAPPGTRPRVREDVRITRLRPLL